MSEKVEGGEIATTTLEQVVNGLDCLNENVLPAVVHTDSSMHACNNEANNDNNNNTTEKKPRPKGFKRRIINLVLFIFGQMFFKFSYISLSGSVGLTILNRLEGNPVGATTILSLLTISFGIAQSISSSAVEGLLKVIRATRLFCISLLMFAFLVVIMIVLEACTDGTLKTPGWWSPWVIFPIYIFIGFSVGIMEVLRKIIPATILGKNDSAVLQRVNAGIHITYEIAATVGAALSSVFLEQMGTIYSLFHIPVCFVIAAVLLFFISKNEDEEKVAAPPKEEVIISSISSVDLQTKEENVELPTPDLQTNAESPSQPDENKPTTETPARPNKFITIMKMIGSAVKNYFRSIFYGAKIVLTSRYYIWLIPCFVIPQIFHRLIENIFLPAYSKDILKKGSYSGLLTGGSHFGELIGAITLLILARRVKRPTLWIISGCLFLNLMWIFPFLTFDGKSDDNLIFSICVTPAMVLISGSWIAGDISQVAYLQSTLSERNEKTGVNELAAVMSFFYSCYIIITTFIAFGVSQAIDRFKENGQPAFGFMTLCIISSVFSVIIGALYFIVAKFKPTEKKEVVQSSASTPEINEMISKDEESAEEEKLEEKLEEQAVASVI